MKRVLVVDDKPENVYFLQALLTGHGYRVDAARHGAEALTRARNAPPDLVISDLLMPVMDGYTLLRHWKSDPRLNRVPFVVYTATYTEPEDERLALTLGADAFILKPSEPEDFLRRLREVEAGTAGGTPTRQPRALADEPDLLKVYSHTLIRKLEEKTLQLEETNRALREEGAERKRAAETQVAILDALPSLIALIDAGGRILAVNEAWRRFAVAHRLPLPGYGIGANYLEVCDRAAAKSDDARAVADGVRQVLAGRLPQFALEYASPAPKSTRWFQLTVNPLPSDPPDGAVVMHFDVTDRHDVEEALQRAVREQQDLATRLRAERAGLAEAQAVARVGSWETDLGTMAVTWSEETHRIFGTDPATFQPTHPSFLALVHPDDRGSVDQAFAASAADAADHTIDHRVVLADGQVKVVQERWRVFHDAAGRPARAAGTCQDITERTTAEATLRESEERFRQLAETIGEVFWISDPAKREILYVSPAYERIWGRPAAELGTDPGAWLDGVHPEDREAVRASFPEQAKGTYDETYRVLRPDGTVRWVRDRAFPVRDGTGTVYRVVGLAEDITERRAIEAQFLRGQRMESVGTLAGGIAHDLNNVLTPILMGLDLLKADDTPEARAETIATIEASARKGADMVRQVLSFSRGVEGRRVVVDVGHVVRDVEKIVNDTFLKTIEVRTAIPPDLPSVVGDPTQLHQVLLNFCVNARDAMPDGGTITISASAGTLSAAQAAASPDPEPGPYVCIEVTDTGTGMPPDVVERIFEPFYTTKELGKGTGLGLSTSLAIVRSHGGFIQVRSTPGAGTTFKVFLPARGQGATPATDARAGQAPRGAGQLILVVDDEPAIREVTRRILEAHGYRVVTAADGAEGVARFTELRDVAVFLTDMMMPVMDGASAITAIRGLGATVPIVAVSGVTEGTRVPPAANVRHLSKPYTTDELMQALHDALQ